MQSTAPTVNGGDTAFVVLSSALVMIMTPGVGFFYGGLVRHKNLVTTLGQCYITFAAISILWYLIGFSLVFSPTSNANGFWGDLKYAALENVGMDPHSYYGTTIPFQLFFFFQLKFAAITPALIVGAVTERVKFSSLLVFITAWSVLVYGPIGHWMWSQNGWLAKLGAIDFAGGLLVHTNSGVAALAAAIVTGRSKDTSELVPCNIPLVLLGNAMLWFGWFGFNGGSSLTASGLAGSACIVTNMAAAFGGLAWMVLQYKYENRVSVVGFATGSVCGLVAITPCSGYITAWASVIVGIFGAAFPFWFCRAKHKYDLYHDTLDAFGCHGIAGMWGTIAVGLFATVEINPMGANGAFYGNPSLLWIEIVALLATVGWSFCGSMIILLVIKNVMGLRVSEEHELQGLDNAVLKEKAMDVGESDVEIAVFMSGLSDVKSMQRIPDNFDWMQNQPSDTQAESSQRLFPLNVNKSDEQPKKLASKKVQVKGKEILIEDEKTKTAFEISQM